MKSVLAGLGALVICGVGLLPIVIIRQAIIASGSYGDGAVQVTQIYLEANTLLLGLVVAVLSVIAVTLFLKQ